MLDNDRLIFNKPINIYSLEILKFIQERMSPHDYEHSFTVRKGRKNGRDCLEEVAVHIKLKKFKDYEHSEYSVNISEKVIPLGESKIYTKKYSYEIVNDNDIHDFIRFDYFPYDNHPHLHINANESKWGDHLVYPETTNLNLEKLDVIKALNIFQKFAVKPTNHILDQEKNDIYVSILEGGK